MKNSKSNQLTLALDVKKHYKFHKRKTSNTLEKKVERILAEKGYSHIYNTSDFMYFKELSKNVRKLYQAEFIADLFIANTSEACDFDEYLI